jgi:SAM-dependent methyltransferase
MSFNFEKSGIVTAEARFYIEAIKSMPNEALVAQSLERKLRQTVLEFRKRHETKPKLVYYCSGPCPILYGNKNLQRFLSQNAEFVGIDLNPEYTEFCRQEYREMEWQTADAVTFKNPNQISILNSSYHHIPPNLKIPFLQNIARNLASDGVVIMGENFLPIYSQESREQSVNIYYDSLNSFYNSHSPVPKSATQLLQSARQNDLSNNGEFKNHIWEFMPHLELAGLMLLRIERVWPVAETYASVDNIPEDYYGSGLLVIKPKTPTIG